MSETLLDLRDRWAKEVRDCDLCTNPAPEGEELIWITLTHCVSFRVALCRDCIRCVAPYIDDLEETR